MYTPIRLLALSCCAFSIIACSNQDNASSREGYSDTGLLKLKQDFHNPPAEAKPRAWWHWMNGNITADGIEKDLQWISDIGIGGLQNFDAAMHTPQIVDERIVYMSDAWQAAFKKAVTLADANNIEFGIAASPGWSETGGPWVEPQDGMKKLVWSQVVVGSNSPATPQLPKPSMVTGPFQNLPLAKGHGLTERHIDVEYYEDVAVLAVPSSNEKALKPQSITVNGENVPVENLVDGNWLSGVDYPKVSGDPRAPSEPVQVEVRFDEPQSVQAITVYLHNAPSDYRKGPLKPTLYAQNNEGAWDLISEFRLGSVPTTASFNVVSSRIFRIEFDFGEAENLSFHAPAQGVDPRSMMGLGSGKPQSPLLAELQFMAEPRINAFETKAAFELTYNYYQLDQHTGQDVPGISPDLVLDLSQYLQQDGTLNWQPQNGTWQVIRLGYSLTGKTNHPATPEATGLEVDKYDADAVERYLRTYLDNYANVLGEDLIGERGLQVLLTDSIEAGASNWTPKLIEKFKQLRGYDPTPWLPTLTGIIIGSRQQSDQFLYDYRRTFAELIASEHYGTVAKIAHEYGLTVYGESLEGERPFATLGDDLEMRRFADIPMAAMWSHSTATGASPKYKADMRGAASVAHLYGKKFVAAESLTSVMAPWAHAPKDLQPMIDQEFLHGINRPVIHSIVHQPVDDKQPGLSLFVFGQFFNRHETWAPMAKPWMSYLARNSLLLQQGQFVADVAYFYGEETPIAVLSRNQYPEDVPAHYGYDFVSPNAILNVLGAENGDWVAPSGMRYRVLFLSGTSQFMTLPVLEKLAALVEQGLTLVGPAPSYSPSLADDSQRFGQLVTKLWFGKHQTRYGKGVVINTTDVEAALATLEIMPDFKAVDAKAPVGFVHRRTQEADLYFVANQGVSQDITGQFRVTGKKPMRWDAVTGEISPLSYRISGDITEVDLSFEDYQSYFVVFGEPTTVSEFTVSPAQVHTVKTIANNWQVDFQENRGASQNLQLTDLQDLSHHDNPGVRYFSGISQYATEFSLTSDDMAGELLLDLGEVGDVAEVFVNGKNAGIAWKKPYQLPIEEFAQEGINSLEVRVANLWVNRLIGDQQPNANPITYTAIKTYLPSAPLRPSGLIGPVSILSQAP